MKQVTFTRDMRPYRANDTGIVPDAIASQLEADEVIKPNPPSWPPDAEAAPEKPAAAAPRPQLRLPQRYRTK